MNFKEFLSALKSRESLLGDYDEFYPNPGQQESKYTILPLLEEVLEKRIDEDVEDLLLCAKLDGIDSDYTDILCGLIQEDWHESHEDIALLLEEIKDPHSLPFLYQAANTQFEYLDYDENFSLAKKCIWAIKAIGGKESVDMLERLAKSDNQIIKSEAKLQLG